MNRTLAKRDGVYVCLACLRPVSDQARPHLGLCGCTGATPAQKAVNFAKSAARHVAAGLPQASEEEVARRFAICQGCEHYDGRACKQCGCPVVRERKFLSKLSWAGESCPIGKWGKLP